jgi:hypothetical protein
MELFHITGEKGAIGIRECGFARSRTGRSPRSAWFCANRDDCVELTSSPAQHYFVIVDIPTEIVQKFREYVDDPDPHQAGDEGLPNPVLYCIPWGVLNSYRPFRFEGPITKPIPDYEPHSLVPPPVLGSSDTSVDPSTVYFFGNNGRMNEHDCRCASFPESWPKCGLGTQATWSPGCDSKSFEAALDHLGFSTRLEFVDWAASRPQGRPGG